MEARELRKGNVVYSTLRTTSGNLNTPFVIDCLHRNTAENSSGETNSYSNLTPITLTEEWLKNLRFDRCDGINTADCFFEIRVGNSWLTINPSNGVVWIINPLDNRFNNPQLIHHVHQLQNLYYTLTGEELEIK